MKHFTIIVAAGTGQRFGGTIPKQFVMLDGKPVLMHSIEKFSSLSEKTIVVINRDFINHWKELVDEFSFGIPHIIVEGGKTRTDSVINGLSVLSEDGIVAIHDAARPLISTGLIRNLFEVAEEKGNAVPAIKVNDSIRKTENENNYSVDRNSYVAIQTPQCFRVKKLQEVYRKLQSDQFTDDASAYEHSGEKINLVQGESSNIKITENYDLMFAETLLKEQSGKA